MLSLTNPLINLLYLSLVQVSEDVSKTVVLLNGRLSFPEVKSGGIIWISFTIL